MPKITAQTLHVTFYIRFCYACHHQYQHQNTTDVLGGRKINTIHYRALIFCLVTVFENNVMATIKQ
jgi:hypothetical protein